ncbi:MAG: hypothetical protein KAS63_09775 [Candidatus Heimdallarchaeota archaeon]|nr:hypothetical protein [Candidatus Heimdallarchaeota archaeon]MCK4955639.1 hypothetical protein [Candidatus Heimdallarchaeota archaeon]
MKVLIWCDIEGISGVDNPETGFNDLTKAIPSASANSAGLIFMFNH